MQSEVCLVNFKAWVYQHNCCIFRKFTQLNLLGRPEPVLLPQHASSQLLFYPLLPLEKGLFRLVDLVVQALNIDLHK